MAPLLLPTIDALDPRTSEFIVSITAGDDQLVSDSVGRAHGAFLSDSARTSPARSKSYSAAGEAQSVIRDDRAALGSRESGRPLAETREGSNLAISDLAHSAEFAADNYSRRSLPGVGFLRWRPASTEAPSDPRNFPFLIAFRVRPGVTTAGDTLVWKPSEKTHLSVICACAQEALAALLFDARTGGPSAAGPRGELVGLAGSPRTGISVGEVSGGLVRPVLLEPGAQDAASVDPDLDSAATAMNVAERAFSNAGQVCRSIKRIYVHCAVTERLFCALGGEPSAIWSMEFEARYGLRPLICENQRHTESSHADEARLNKARVLTRGEQPGRERSWYPATVLIDVIHDMPIVTEKTFGPVILLVIFDPVDEVVSMVQRNEYGLVLTLVTDDLGRAEAFDGEDVDIVWIDAWDGHAAGTPHDRVEQNGSGAGGWRGESFLDLGTPPQFVKFPGPAIEGIAQ